MKSNTQNQPHGFTLIEIMVTIAIIALLMGILIPALSSARKSANRLKSSTQVRNIQGAFVGYAKSNNDWYPGTDALGRFVDYNYDQFERTVGGPTTSSLPSIAFGLIVNNLLIPAGELVSPIEQTGQKQIYQLDVTGVATAGNFSNANFSYALMSTGDYISAAYTEPQRKALWRANGNSQQPLISDRLLPTVTVGGLPIDPSIHNTKKAWMGNLGWNDGHVTWEQDRIVSTQMSTRVNYPADDLFANDDAPATNKDFLMVH